MTASHPAFGTPAPPINYSSLLQKFQQPPDDSRVMVRWWWFGCSNTEKDIDQQLDAMLQAGIGGVELSPVYPVAVHQPTSFGSPRFLELVSYASQGAKRRGMRFDMIVGSGWSFGGAHVTPQYAAKRIRFEERAIGPAAQQIDLSARWPGDELIAAWVCDGAMGEGSLDYKQLRVEKNVVSVTAGGSPRTLLVATSGPTTQQLKRASNGAEGPTLDHYSRDAALHHLEAIGKPMFDAAGGSKNVTSIFCDSLEVYMADWTQTLPEEFEQRRGYNPVPLLYHLNNSKASGNAFRAEYYRTLSEIYEENFLAVCQSWAHDHGTLFRVQNYGAPPCRISGFKYADMIEGEAWGWERIPQSKWAASAAHHLGVNVVSSETWTWLNSPSFKARPLDFKGEAHEHVLCGINQFIGHGWPSSPLDTVDPGWAFYAACAITDRNAWWKAASKPMFAYLHRLSEVMRQGEPIADVGLWMPYEDTYAGFEHGEELNLWRFSAKRLGQRITGDLRRSGYDYDAVDSGIPAESISRRHRVVIVANSATLSKDDVATLGEVAANGTPTLVVDSDILPQAVHVSMDDAMNALSKLVAPDFPTGNPHIGVVHRRLQDAEVYFVANTSPDRQALNLEPRTAFKSWEKWDLHNGSVSSGAGKISCTLAPYEAFVYVTFSNERGSATKTSSPDGKVIQLEEWSYHCPNADQERVKVPHVWADDNFVGTASYTTRINLPITPGTQLPTKFVLDTTSMPTPARSARRGQSYEAHAADPVGVIAALRVNGKEAGVLWDPPYELTIGQLLQHGSNEIELAISTTSVAGMRSEQWLNIWKDAEKAHGRRFIMQEIEHAFDSSKSGLLVVPHLR